MLNCRWMNWQSSSEIGRYAIRVGITSRAILCLVVALALAGMAACGELGPEESDGGGGMRARLLTRGNSQLTRGLTLDSSVTILRATVSASDMEDVTVDFDTSITEGAVENIPAGSFRTLTVQGLDASENIVMEGVTCGITVVDGQTADAGTVLINTYSAPDPSLETLTGLVSGVVVDAEDASLLSGVSVQVCNAGFGFSESDTTGDTGAFELIATQAGTQTLSFTFSGYIKANRTLDVGANTTTSLGVVPLSRTLSGDETRMVLTWGQSPGDLDFHTLTPGGEHIYFANATGDGISLDVDVQSGFGPETITISTQQAGTYTVYVHNFTGSFSTTLSNSGANVEVYESAGLVQSVDVASGSTTSDDYWNVLTLTDGVLNAVNTFSSVEPTSP